jgi:hypothetical protein
VPVAKAVEDDLMLLALRHIKIYDVPHPLSPRRVFQEEEYLCFGNFSVAVFDADLGKIFSKDGAHPRGTLDESRKHGAARYGFDTDRPDAGSEIEDSSSFHPSGDNFENDFAQFAIGVRSLGRR